ncbi:FlaD/FlaE family flagellar protein [Halorussus halophilus]|uniref:FlaD/FlaE family flagellar protein n=1 Tax=Halorussus halophilus TaxID=2650975 RepID=UPI001CE44594|nr:FlaD/FlaE family flagellar protein [Halorussus halophilus]
MKLIGLSDQFVHLVGTSMVAMGIMDFMDEEEGENVEAEGGGDDELFGDGMGDGMDGGMNGGMDGGMDDDFGDMGDDMGMEDGMGDWADGGGGDDEFGGMGGGGGPTQELENRIDELENEVAEISSTVGTVRSENEQISGKVDDAEENVRKLLEIYEMVTRGVNPFVDDVQGGGMGDGMGGGALGGDEGGFGLFDGEQEEEEEEDLDSDIADAEAESFFDDDFEDEEDDFEGEDDDLGGDDLGFDSPDEGMGEVDDMNMETDTDDADDADGGQAGGSTFQDLKEEYESGDADWAEEEEGEETDADPEQEPTVEVEAEPESPDGDFEFDEPDDTEPTEAEPATPVQSNSSGLDSKPYLARLPSGYVSDLVVMEWLEFLVTEFGADDAVRTITYYGDIGWISESVEEELLSFVGGFADVNEVDPGETGPAALEIDDHIQSLTFLSQLTGDAVQRKIVEHCAQIRGGRDGIQR